jgi:hypothetical protein
MQLRGTAAPIRYNCTYEAQLHLCTSTAVLRGTHLRGATAPASTAVLRGIAAPTRYSYAYHVQLHLRGTATQGAATPTRNEVQLQLRGTSIPTLEKAD